MKGTVGRPSLKKAREHAKALLPHDQSGNLLPLSCPLECFQIFGSGVYVYMMWVQLMKRIFTVAFLFSLVFLLLVSVAQPFKDDSDDLFAKACGFALTALFFFSLVLKLGMLVEAVGVSGVASAASGASMKEPATCG